MKALLCAPYLKSHDCFDIFPCRASKEQSKHRAVFKSQIVSNTCTQHPTPALTSPEISRREHLIKNNIFGCLDSVPRLRLSMEINVD